jgi:hypothetical protein
VTIPLQSGFYKGSQIYYIVTEASDNPLAQSLTSKTGFRVVFASVMSQAPQSSLADVYLFTNGLAGSGLLGFQPEVHDTVPSDQGYSPARVVNRVTWNPSATSTQLKSVDEILSSQSSGALAIERTNVMLNAPMISWPGGQLVQADSTQLTNQTGYGHGQLVSIDTTGGKAVLKAHRCWAEDGSQFYYIVADASLQGLAGDLGTTFAGKMQGAIQSPAAADFFVFVNGIQGPGPKGFQSSIGSSKPGDPKLHAILEDKRGIVERPVQSRHTRIHCRPLCIYI